MGCKPDFSPQSCEPGSEVSFQLMTVADIYWPLDGSVYEEHSYVNDKFCMDNCLEDCSCSAAIYSEAINGGTCWKKKLPLSNGRRNKDVASRTAFIKFSPLNSSTSAPPILGAPPTKPYKSRIKVVAIIVSLVFGILLLSCIFCFLWKRKRRLGKILQQQQSAYLSFLVFGILLLSRICWCLRKRKKRRQGVKDRSNEMDGENSLDLPLVDFHTIVSATNNFSAENKLGEGGFGPVYKGKLGEDQEVAVKRLCKTSQQGVDEFRNEVILIAKLQHRNLVRLLGCCIHGEERMLVYEYMPNKSLDAFLFGKDECTFLSWRTRYQIIIGIARGLLYLHQDSRLRIIHRDLKASNILLDKDMIPKISDFGMARIFEGDESDFNTRKVVGTYGYMSPEYALEGTFSMKSDIFSFGVLVLEIVSGRKNRGLYTFSPHLNLLAHAWSLWSEGDILQLAQEGMSSVPTNEVLKCIKIGLLCVQERPEDRPLMSNVIEMFSSDISSLSQPNPPGFVSRFGPTEIERQEPCSLNGVSISELSSR